MANNEAVRICCLGHFVPAFVRHAAEFGFDCIWLDFEHRCWTDREIQAILPLFHLYDIDCLLRVPTTEKTRLYRFLEDGATGKYADSCVPCFRVDFLLDRGGNHSVLSPVSKADGFKLYVSMKCVVSLRA